MASRVIRIDEQVRTRINYAKLMLERATGHSVTWGKAMQFLVLMGRR